MDAPEKRPKGRPRMPDTTVINLRIARDLLERVDRYIDSEARDYRSDINRATITRKALESFLSEKGYSEPQKNFLMPSVVKFKVKN